MPTYVPICEKRAPTSVLCAKAFIKVDLSYKNKWDESRQSQDVAGEKYLKRGELKSTLGLFRQSAETHHIWCQKAEYLPLTWAPTFQHWYSRPEDGPNVTPVFSWLQVVILCEIQCDIMCIRCVLFWSKKISNISMALFGLWEMASCPENFSTKVLTVDTQLGAVPMRQSEAQGWHDLKTKTS